MADLTITISNRLRFREATDQDVLSLWGTMVWGTDLWYGDFDTPWEFEQWLANSLSFAQSLGKHVEKGFAETVTLSDAFYRAFGKKFNLGIGFSDAITGNAITQGVWTRQALDTESWSEQTADTESWSEQAAASTTWS